MQAAQAEQITGRAAQHEQGVADLRAETARIEALVAEIAGTGQRMSARTQEIEAQIDVIATARRIFPASGYTNCTPSKGRPRKRWPITSRRWAESR